MLTVKVEEDAIGRKLTKIFNPITNSQSIHNISTPISFETSFSESVDHMET